MIDDSAGGSTEELDADLWEYLDEEEGFLDHPLVRCTSYTPAGNHRLNQLLEDKRQALNRAFNDSEWTRWLYLHERPHRLDALLMIRGILAETARPLGDEELWELAARLWMDSENVSENEAEWTALFRSGNPRLMMNRRERRELARLADRIRIYRGYSLPEFARGLSWTLNYDVAERFAERFAVLDGLPCLADAVVRRADVIALLDGRDEEEIVALPDSVRVIETHRLA